MNGSEFLEAFPTAHGERRESAILQAVRDGHYVLRWVPITVGELTFYVSADVLRIGDECDSIRVSGTQETHQRIADLIECNGLPCMLPTARISDLIYQNADAKIDPQIQSHVSGLEQMSTVSMLLHHEEIEAALKGREWALAAPLGKDWVLTRALHWKATRAANYGWQCSRQWKATPTQPSTTEGLRVIQPIGTAHSLEGFTDYSQTMRLVRRDCLLLGFSHDLADVLEGQDAHLISHEGAMDARHPGVDLLGTVEVPLPSSAPSSTQEVPRLLHSGMRGTDIKAWQQQLVDDGYGKHLGAAGADGFFGHKTRLATEAWQNDRGIDSDGIVGSVTRSSIGLPVVDTDTDPPPSFDIWDEATPASEGIVPFKQARHYRSAGRTYIKWVVMHVGELAAQKGSARNLATYANTMGDARVASWHYSIDAEETWQSVSEVDIAFAAPGANREGLQVELCTYTYVANWLDDYHQAMLERSAKLVAGMCNRWNIPAEHVNASDMINGLSGICGHSDVSAGVGKGRTTHQDPGVLFPWDHFLARVSYYLG